MVPQKTLTQQVYALLRGEVLTCVLAPGEKLNIKEISERLGVSLGAVREALSRLTSEGFVTVDRLRGFRAAPISAADLRDLVLVRSNIEGQCLRRSIEIGGIEWETQIVAAGHRLSKTSVIARDSAVPKLTEEYAQAHATFHRELVSACDSPWLIKLREWLYAQSERYRYLTIALAQQERDIAGEHDAILAAVLDRDADRAVRLLSEHLLRTAEVVLGGLFQGSPEIVDKRPTLRVVKR